MYDRRAIFLRAHQLYDWNKGSRSAKYTPKVFAEYLKMAWAEAKAGTLPSFAPEAVKARKIQSIREHIVEIQHQDRISWRDYELMAALRAELTALAA